MESNPVEMYQISNQDQSSNKENVILRALVGNPNRHKPQAQHPPPTTLAVQEAIPASMYTLETRYQPIPVKVLPKPTEARLYHIDSTKSEERIQETPLHAEPNRRNVDIEEEATPAIFLEPKIVSEPVLYSIVGAKQFSIDKAEQIPTDKEKPSPVLYTVTGKPRPLPTNLSTLNVETPHTDNSPTLYSLVGNPRFRAQIQEPIKEPSEQLQQPASLYSVVGRPHLQPQIREPTKQIAPSISQQSTSTMYSIIGGPVLTQNIPQIIKTNNNPPPLTQSVKVIPSESVPVLYTIVGESQVPKKIPKENRPPLPPPPVSLAPIKNPPNDVTMYTMIGDPVVPQTATLPPKNEQLKPYKQPKQQTQPQASALYTVIGKPTTPSEESMDRMPRQILRRKSPPSVIAPTGRISRSLDRRPPREPVTRNDIFLPQVKRPRQARSKEPTIPKSETTFIPLSGHERSRRPRPSPRRMSAGKLHRNDFNIPQYDPLQLPDYISPYAYHPSRPYRQETYDPVLLPPLGKSRYQSKPKPPFSEPYDSRAHRSLERYPIGMKQRSRLWDYEDGAQSDTDDGDDINNQNSNRKKQGYRRYRPRTPWIPVW